MSSDPTNDDFAPAGTGTDGKTMWNDDLKESSKQTLASYMSALTTNAQTHNEYSIDDSEYAESSYVAADGSPASFETGGIDTGAKTFTNELEGPQGSAARTLFDTMSNSGKFDEVSPMAVPLSQIVDKNSQVDGHSLLTDIKGTGSPFEHGVGDSTGQTWIPTPSSAPPQQVKISNILKGYNRFNPSGATPYINDGAFSSPGSTEQMGFGVYDPDAEAIDYASLKKVAESLLLRQTGHAKEDSADPALWNEIAVIPGTTVQTGVSKISIEFLKSINAFGAPRKPILPAYLEYDDISGAALHSRKSFGAMNSNKEPFAGKNRLAALTVCIGALGPIIVGSLAVGGIIEILNLGVTPIPSTPASMQFGRHRTEPLNVRVLRVLGVPPVSSSFIKCIIYGLIEFLGFGAAIGTPPDSAFGSWPAFILWWNINAVPLLATATQNVLWALGYYTSIFRVVSRDLLAFINDLTEIDLSDAAGAATAVFRLMRALTSFPSFRFFMVLATIGDIAIMHSSRSFPLGGAGSNPLEKMPNNGQTRQAQSKIAKDKSELAWRHRAAPARFILPEQLMTAFEVFDMGKGTPAALLSLAGDAANEPGASFPAESAAPHWKKQQRNKKISTSGRLPKEMVTALENQLEIEYMPFYLHDLRTNEVIGLHGFLETIKDSYSVSYADSSGYGRIDKVKIYQSTERSINLDFWLVSTSKKDFDSMWFTINKLITLLYPQWSMGKRVAAGKKHFVMPFSQIPTASPMIRLRVGDVIRSNYSRFNLARLFGISEAVAADVGGTSANDVAASAPPFDISYDTQTGADWDEYEIELAAHAERHGSEPDSPTDSSHGFVAGQEATLLANSEGYTTWDRGSGDAEGVSPGPAATHVETAPFLSRTVSDARVKVLSVRWLGLADQADGIEAGTVDAMSMRNSGHNVEYCVTWTDPDQSADPYSKALADKGHYHHYYVLQEDLLPDLPEISTLDENVTLDEQIENVAEFFSPDNNAIVSSFEAAGGRGLAGFITSFDMDWNQSSWDMSAMGRRAPTAMKISIAFAPIHDIPPGLDSNGFMRSVNYPVGEIAGMLGTDQYDEGSSATVNVSTPSGASRRAGGVDSGKLTRERFEAAVNEAFAGGDGSGGSP